MTAPLTWPEFALLLVSISAALSAIMAGAWLIWRRTRNSGWVDTDLDFRPRHGRSRGCAFAVLRFRRGDDTAAARGFSDRIVVGAARSAYRATHRGHRRRSALRQAHRRLGIRCGAADVLAVAETGLRQHSAGAVDAARGLQSRCRICACRIGSAFLCLLSASAVKLGPISSCAASAPIRLTAVGSATTDFGAGRGIRIISSNGSVGLLIRCSRSTSAAATSWGFAALAGPLCMYLAAGACLRHPAARSAYAGAPPRRISRLSVTHQCILSGAATRGVIASFAMTLSQTLIGVGERHVLARPGDADGDQVACRPDPAAAAGGRAR